MPARRRSTSSPKRRTVRRTRKVSSKSPAVRRVGSKRTSKKVRSIASKKVNPWVQFILTESKKRGISYKEALQDKSLKTMYKKK